MARTETPTASFLHTLQSTPIPANIAADRRVRVVSRGDGRRGEMVVYWAQAYRRATSNAALSYAISVANERGLPLLVYEALRPDYPHASDRLHAFVIEGARDEAHRYRERGAGYAFFLPRSTDEARGVLARLCDRAEVLITDDYPTFVIPQQIAAVARKARCAVIAFDDNAVVPLANLPRDEYAARTIRPQVLRMLPAWLAPIEEPSCRVAWREIDLPFEVCDLDHLDIDKTIALLPIDHAVSRVRSVIGGGTEARRRLATFISKRLGNYDEQHNHPDAEMTSTLSAHIHFGMISAREIALAVRHAGDVRSDLSKSSREAFLEQLLVRRTLAFNYAWTNPLHRSYDALPSWARKTLEERTNDPRAKIYTREQLESARTGDEVWNAAQREFIKTGVIQNYLRMIWGKGVLAWKATPREAFDELVHMNDRWGLDGRDPNTYASIAWCFGKHDRPWGPSRPIFGNVRYMSSALTPKKIKMKEYLRRFGA